MGCIFGYVGQPLNGLLDQMGDRLIHRCKKGIEKVRMEINSHQVVEIGHGIPSWSEEKRTAVNEFKKNALGYSGVINNLGKNNRYPAHRLLTELEGCGSDDLRKLEGSFVMAFINKKCFYLMRDSAGIKAVYWSLNKERLVFASEIKALFADPQLKPQLRLSALPEFLTFSFIPGKQTMLENIEELQPGHLLTFEKGKVSQSRYFSFEHLEPEKPTGFSIDNEAKVFRSQLERSVKECCEITDQEPAIFLSGGIDSSAVLAVMANLYPNKRINTFSVHFGSKYANENHFISMMVEKYKTRHTWLEIRPSGFINRLKEIIWKLDDPIGDPITVPNFLLAEAASKVTGLVLNGEGGDPCFGGPKNISMILAHLYGPPSEMEATNWLEQNYLQSYRKCYADLDQILNPDVFDPQQYNESLNLILNPFFQTEYPRSFLNKLMTINIRLKGANLILVKVDKMTSANGVLALAPLFSKQIIQSSMRFPPTFKLQGNIEKAILKRAVKDIVPVPILERPKSGMMVPVRFWFQKEMKRYARRLLSKKKLNNLELFNTRYVRDLLKYQLDDLHGMRYGTKLWMLITFMLWHEQMIESSGKIVR